MRVVGFLVLVVAALLGSVCAIYAHRVARLVPFAKDYGVTARVSYMTGIIPFPFTYIDVAHPDCPDWIRQEYRHHRGVSIAAAVFFMASCSVLILIGKIAQQW